MALVYCPECAHEVSETAVACPNCGHPMGPPIVEPLVDRKTVIAPRRRDGFPPWAFAVIAASALLLLIIFFIWFRSSDDTANTNVNVNMAQRRAAQQVPGSNTTASMPSSETTVPSTQTGVSLPPEVPQSVPGQSTTVPGTSP